MRAGSRYPGLVIVAAALIVSVAGCVSGINPATEANRAVSIATTHGGSSGEELILPINAYAYTVPERHKLGWARNILIGECMRGFGYSYDAEADAAQSSRLNRIDIQNNGFYGNKRRYSVTDMATAAKYGYHLVSTVADATSPAHRASPPGLGTLNAAGRVIMFGSGPDGRRVSRAATGRRVPAGGCVGAADAKFVGSGSAMEAKLVSDLGARSYQQSLKNRAVVAAFQAWSTCMIGKGYHYTSPVDDIGFDLDTKVVSVRETTTARADVSCKQQTRLVDIWFHAEVVYQNKWIEQHAEQFHKAKSDHDTTMKQVSRIIAGRH